MRGREKRWRSALIKDKTHSTLHRRVWLTQQPPCDLRRQCACCECAWHPAGFTPWRASKVTRCLNPSCRCLVISVHNKKTAAFSFFLFDCFHDAMPIFKQSIKPYTSRGRINLQCIIRISLRWCVSLKMMSKLFHESFRLKPLTCTHTLITLYLQGLS